MGIFSGILGAALPVIGGMLGGPVGSALGVAASTGSDLGRALGSGVSSAISAHDSREATVEQNQLNTAQADKQMAFQRDQQDRAHAFSSQQIAAQREYESGMSNSAYQRAIADMRAAGLNPMLAYHQGGASTPSSPSPAGTTGGPGARAEMAAPGLAAVNTALTAAKLQGELQKMSAETDERRTAALVNLAQVPKLEQDTKTSVSSAANLEAQTKNILERLRVLMPEEHAKLVSEIYLNNARSNLTVEQWKHEFDKSRLTKAEVEIALLHIPQLRNQANQQDTWWMRNVSPYLPDFLRGSSGTGSILRMMR